MPGALFWLMLPLHVFLNLIAIVGFILFGQGRIIYRAKKDALSAFPLMWQKRRDIQNNRRVSVAAIWKALDKRLFPGVPQVRRVKF